MTEIAGFVKDEKPHKQAFRWIGTKFRAQKTERERRKICTSFARKY